MSEEKMAATEREELAILQALESLNVTPPSNGGSFPIAADSEQERLQRQYVELLGLLPLELEPITPSPEIEAGILARIRNERVEAAASRPPTQLPVITDGSPLIGVRSGSGRWLLPLAAVFALVLIGATLLLSTQIRSQQETIVGLADQLDSANAKIDAMSDLQSRFALVTQAGVEICALRPSGADPAQSGARAALYVSPDHSRWYLVVDGLEPTPDGHSYQVWFAAADGPVSAGVFESRAGERVELDAAEMPRGTNGVFITLERGGGHSRPTGDRILFGDEVMQIL